MKRINFFLLLLAFVATAGMSVMNAQVPDGYYKKYHINQDFEGLEGWPTGWSAVSSTSAFFGHAAATYSFVTDGFAQGFVKVTASGSGTRGGEIRFPSTSTYAEDVTGKNWFIEFDWTVNSADWDARQANGIMLSGQNSQGVNTSEDWYGDVILGLYVYKSDGYFHYWNMDPMGEPKLDAEGNVIPGEFNGPAFYNQNGNNGKFTRGGTAKDNWTVADSLNLKTQTDVTFAAGVAYHIFAELDFATQKVVKLTITDTTNPENTQTISNLDFLAPTMGGTNSPVAVENRIVTQLDRMQSFHTRSGGSGALNHSYDNWEVYVLEQSLGQKDVTINYLDSKGNPVKEARVAQEQEVGNPYSLLVSDKARFEDDAYYYACDIVATHAANAAKGEDGESVVVSLDGDNSLTVIYKKSAISRGLYTWTGFEGFKWDELESNFSTPESGEGHKSYQNGNPVAFTNAEVLNKEIEVVGQLNLGEGDFTVSAEGYSFSGSAVIEGTGTTMVDASTILGIDNRLEGGAWISTTGEVHLKHVNAAKSIKYLVDGGNLKLEANADFAAPITTPEDGTLNIECVSNNIYLSPITGATTINLLMSTYGSHNANWRSSWRVAFPEGAQVNVTTELAERPLMTGFGVRTDDFINTKLHLGDGIRLLRDYNEGNNTTFASTMRIGELSGTDKAVIETGFVDGRSSTIEVGSLNTDAVFGGGVRRYMNTDSTSVNSLLRIRKVGTGSWTIGGSLNFEGEVLVDGGTLVLNGEIAETITKIDVDTAATLVLVHNNILANTGISVNIGTLSGAVTANNISLTGSTLKMNVNSFEADDFDQIVTLGDFVTIPAVDPEDLNVLDITINAATEGAKITLIDVQGNGDIFFDKVLVNGEDITDNEPDTEGAKFVFTWDADTGKGELLSLVDFTGVRDVMDGKMVQSVDYYDITGKLVNKNTEGLIIMKIKYTDGTNAVRKTFVKTK